MNLGHAGNCITELINFHDIFDPFLKPKTWRGAKYNGTEWSVAKIEILNAMIHVTHTYSFSKFDKELIKKEVIEVKEQKNEKKDEAMATEV